MTTWVLKDVLFVIDYQVFTVVRSGTQYVAMVTKIVSSYCRPPLVEPYCKKTNISDKHCLRYPCLSYFIKIRLSV